EVVQHLLKHKDIEVDVLNKDHQTVLHCGINKGKGYETIIKEILLKKHDIINLQDIDGNTALHLAVKYDNIEIVEILLAYEAKVDIKNKFLKTPAKYSKNDYMSLLLSLSHEFQS